MRGRERSKFQLMGESRVVLSFDAGTLVLDGVARTDAVPARFRWDERVLRWRAPAWAYRHVVKDFIRRQIPFSDQARAYDKFDFPTKLLFEPRPYQAQAIKEW